MHKTRAVVAYNGATTGLGNRVRVTLGAARYATYVAAPFYYVWPTTPHFAPRIDELWEWSAGRRIPRSVSRMAGPMTGYTDNDLRSAGPRQIIQIRTGAELLLPPEAGDWRQDLRALVPVSEIAEDVVRIHREEFGIEPYVGVQIRAHEVSHQRTKDTSAVEWFTSHMERLVNERPGTRFYLSCDVLEVKLRILQDFPTATANVTSAPYNSTAAVRAALVDLYLLASSSYMLGPHFSSFIELAQFLADLKVPTDKPVQPPCGVESWWELGAASDPLAPAMRR
ncbi:hypothetical protein [Brachybacterium sp. AOP29-B2-41]|uniref:hypothetical protein n=1 Tax=Brachybacterium sp. AOP29-B2-41 TaxID=3457704 RepID=UPI00403369F7